MPVYVDPSNPNTVIVEVDPLSYRRPAPNSPLIGMGPGPIVPVYEPKRSGEKVT